MSDGEALALLDDVKENFLKIAPTLNIEVIICPSFTRLGEIKRKLKDEQMPFKLGAQDCFWEESGAYTGEVSPCDLKNIGCEFVILGHSERRIYFGETNETLIKKINAALAAGLIPIFCVGETKEDRASGKTEAIIKKQLKALIGVKINNERFLIAYEPMWAIGTGKACSSTEAVRMHDFIKKEVRMILGKEAPILYGGSVDSANVSSYLANASIAGVLVGGASAKKEIFVKLLLKANQM